jgi:hypothetical protein
LHSDLVGVFPGLEEVVRGATVDLFAALSMYFLSPNLCHQFSGQSK